MMNELDNEKTKGLVHIGAHYLKIHGSGKTLSPRGVSSVLSPRVLWAGEPKPTRNKIEMSDPDEEPTRIIWGSAYAMQDKKALS